MKRSILHSILFTLVLGASARTVNSEAETAVYFLENKGQVKDQHMHARPDVLFSGTAGHTVFHLLQNGISYQFNRIDEWKESKDKFGKSIQEPVRGNTYRLDLHWKNAGAQIVSGLNALAGYSNFYCRTAPMGVGFVRSYGKVVYTNLYPGIDLHYYSINGQLKYDLIVSPGSDHRQIQLDIKGATEIHLNADGSVTLETPLGSLAEGAPLVYQDGKQIEARWTLHENTLAFELGAYDHKRPLLIDPLVRSWGTWYGGTGTDYAYDCSTDGNGNSYITGQTNTGFGTVIATSGSHMSTTSSSTWNGAYLVKFNANGTRLWGTYYGGGGSESGYGCVANDQGEVYMTGLTVQTTGTVIATPGSHQPLHFGAGFYSDAFLVKFDNSGQRIWGTYYGGNNDDWGNAVALDALGNVYMAGMAISSVNIASPGSHQTNFGFGSFPYRGDGFLVKFNSNGVQQWGTYYGATGEDAIHDVDVSASGDVFIAGHTASFNSTNIATPGAHQTVHNGGSTFSPYDAFVAKFNSSGVRQWGTYYGGTQSDQASSCTGDASGNVYLVGASSSTNSGFIATPGSFEPTSSSPSAFLVKFDVSGVRQWGTYYTGGGSSSGTGSAINSAGNIYFSGNTFSSPSLSTPGAFQTVSGGSGDGFLALFDPSGLRLESTYYGGTANEGISACVTNTLNQVFCVGNSSVLAGTAVVSPNGHQPVHGGNTDGFLVKFVGCAAQPTAPVNTSPNPNLLICSGKSATLTASASGTIFWYTSLTASVAAATGSLVTLLPGTAPGTYTYFLENNDCAPSPNRTSVTLTVNALPSVAVTTVAVCPGISVTLSASGASSYTWSTGPTGSSLSMTPTVSQTVLVTGMDASTSCTNSATGLVNVLSAPLLTLVATPSALCAGGSVTLNVAGAPAYTWSTGESDAAITASLSLTSVFEVTATAQNGCKSTASVSVVVDPCTHMAEVSAYSRARIFPNPGIGLYQLEISEPAFFKLSEASGRLLSEMYLQAGTHPLDLLAYPRGIYFVELRGDTFLKTVKVIRD